jgi:hypothetical protein
MKLIQKTDYPESGRVEIRLQQNKPAVYTLRLRIPYWSKNTELQVNGQLLHPVHGNYVSISREWKDGDQIILKLDLRGRIITAPGNANYVAIMRGPVVLALDNRFVKSENIDLWLLSGNERWKHDDQLNIDYVLREAVSGETDTLGYIELVPVSPKPSEIWMAFEVPFIYKPTHFFNHARKTLIMCDYASAGNQYNETNLFRVWMPQPMFMNDLFPVNTWKILDYDIDHRPVVPVFKK